MMRIDKILVLAASSIYLTGCISNSESKVTDLGGIVFLLFMGITASKYVGPKVFSLPVFSRLRVAISQIGNKVFLFSLPVAITLVTYGLMNSILDRLLALVGLTLIVVSYHLKDLSSDNMVVRARAFDIVGMGVVIEFVLFSLWLIGADLFKL